MDFIQISSKPADADAESSVTEARPTCLYYKMNSLYYALKRKATSNVQWEQRHSLTATRGISPMHLQQVCVGRRLAIQMQLERGWFKISIVNIWAVVKEESTIARKSVNPFVHDYNYTCCSNIALLKSTGAAIELLQNSVLDWIWKQNKFQRSYFSITTLYSEFVLPLYINEHIF